MKNIKLFLFAISFSFFSSVSLAADLPKPTMGKDDAPACGVIYSTDGDTDSPLIVEEHNMRICEEDLSFNVFYMLFGDLLQSPLAQESVSLFVDVSTSTKSLNDIGGLGTSILSIFQALSSLVFYLGGIWILWQTGKYIYAAQTSGKFLGNNGQGNKMALSVAMQGMTTIFLITPVGSILMIQLIILLLSIVGIMLANYFLSSFLHHTYVKTTEVQINKPLLMDMGHAYTSSMTEIDLCEQRTATAILNKNTIAGSAFIEESPDAWSAFDDNEVDDFLEITYECVVKYHGLPSQSSKTEGELGRAKILQQAYNSCDQEEVDSEIDRSNKSFGYPHTCGTYTFAWPDMGYLNDMGVQDEDEDGIEFIEDSLSSGKYKSEFSTKSYYDSYYSDAKDFVSSVINDVSKTDNEKKKSLHEYYLLKGEEYYTDFSAKEILSSDTFSNIKNQKIRLDLIAATHINSINYLLGGYLEKDEGFGEDPDYNYYEKDKLLFGFDYFRNISSKIASKKLIASHCAEKWDELYDSRVFFKYFEGITDTDSVDAVDFLNHNEKNFECLYFEKANNDDEEGTFSYVLDHADTFNDIDTTTSSRDMASASITSKKMVEEVAPDLKREAKIEMEVLKGYYFAVKYGMLKSMAEKIKESADTGILVKARERGWAFLGSLMLEIANSQGNARKYVDTIMETSGAYPTVAQNGVARNYFNVAALSENPSGEQYDELLKSMNIGEIFSDTSSLTISENSAVLDDDSYFFQLFVKAKNWIKNYIFSPIVYIQRGSGMDSSYSLDESLEECAKTNECVPSDSHPINTLMMFGQDLISKAITIILIGIVADMVSKIDGGGKKDSGGGINMSAILGNIPFLKAITFIADIISALINAISPFLYTMLFVGVLCAYLLPTLPYITFAIVFLNWIINIFVVLFTSPILVLMMGKLDENGNNQISFSRLWQSYGSVLLKPALITVAMIFAWTLSSVSLFFINSTIYPLFMSIGSSSSSFTMEIISTASIYIIYISTIIIVVRHSFSIISSFADEFLSIIGVRGTGDANIVQNMNLERLLVAGQAAKHLQQGATGGANLAKDTGSLLKRRIKEKMESKNSRTPTASAKK